MFNRPLFILSLVWLVAISAGQAQPTAPPVSGAGLAAVQSAPPQFGKNR